MKKILLLTFLLLAVKGCGFTLSQEEVTSVAQMQGVWDDSLYKFGKQDVRYQNISSSGRVTTYDYLGDNYNRGPNCFSVSNGGQITHIRDNLFRFTSDTQNYTMHAHIKNNDILILVKISNNQTIELPRIYNTTPLYNQRCYY